MVSMWLGVFIGCSAGDASRYCLVMEGLRISGRRSVSCPPVLLSLGLYAVAMRG